ncbi:MAG: RecQ family ATP-dependent helicase, partial [Frankiales bacterium]|nr:RecQ family ATP-dependent helicase [Frankiales bacterium]
ALTATAAPPVQAEITRELRMRQPALVVADFDRPNITLAVRRAHVGMAEDRAIVDRAVELALEFPTPTLVYAVSHARCEELAERLGRVALRAAAYHAGLSAAVRARVQDDFFNSRLDVVVATSAFGMGIDKPDVRTVIHAGVPGSLDEYYQEIGRAGRDGQPANAVLVYDPRGLRIPKLFAARTAIRDADVAAVVQALLAHPGRQSLAELTAASRVAGHTAQRLTEELRELGLITLDERGVTARSGLRSTTGPNAVERIEDAGRRRLAILGSRIDSVRHYAETVRCRRAELLAYFGEALTPPCGNCDNDAVLGRRPAAAPRPAAEPVKAQLGPDGPAREPSAREPSARDPSSERITVGMTVRHRLWGTGTLLSADEHELVVAFGAVGYRHLTPLALTNGLLTPA